jgi:predicted  nucleic acid-binding Zn-ribbon protein
VTFSATTAELRILLELARLDDQAPSPEDEAWCRRREALRRQAAPPLLERYDALLGLNRTPAVVAVEQGACSGCHIRLATMVVHQVRHGSVVSVCPRCRRLLYAPERLGEREAAPAAPDRNVATRRGARVEQPSRGRRSDPARR